MSTRGRRPAGVPEERPRGDDAAAFNTLAPELLVLVLEFLADWQLPSVATVCKATRKPAAIVVARRAHSRAVRLMHEALRWVDANAGDIVIAGSAALWWHLGCPREWRPNDVDLFYVGMPSDVDSTGVSVTLNCPPHTLSACHGHNVWFYPHIAPHRPRTCMVGSLGKLQFIVTPYWNSWQAVTGAFDLTCCMVAIDGRAPTGRPRVRLHSDYSYPAVVARLPPRVQATAVVRGYWQSQEQRTALRVCKYRSRGVNRVTFDRVGTSHPALTFAAGYVPTLTEMAAGRFGKLGKTMDDRKAGVFGSWYFFYDYSYAVQAPQ